MTVIRLAAHTVPQQRRAQGRPQAEGARAAAAAVEDRQLMRTAAEGSVEAWFTLVASYAPDVWEWAIGAGSDEQTAAEVCEVVWLRLAQSLATLDCEPVPTWLHRQVLAETRRHQPLARAAVNRLRVAAEQ